MSRSSRVMSKSSFVFDERYYIQRNKEVAMELYGNRLDADRNIVGTNYYFDRFWRLCSKVDKEGGR